MSALFYITAVIFLHPDRGLQQMRLVHTEQPRNRQINVSIICSTTDTYAVQSSTTSP